MFLPHFDVFCDLLQNRRTATWNISVLSNNETNYYYTAKAFLIQNISAKAGLCPLWWTRKKTIWRNLLSIQNEAISLVAMRSKELWLLQENHATVKLDSSVAYSESNIELRNLQILKKIGWISRVSFCHQSSSVSRRAWMLPWILQELNTLGKLAIAVNLESIRFEFFGRKRALVTVEICVLCDRGFSNQIEIVSEMPFSCDTVGREL